VSRFAIRRAAWVRPLLVLFGGTAERSFIDVAPDRVLVRFGWTELTIPRAAIHSVEPVRYPLWGGIGWRWNFGRTIGLVGATAPVVRFRLDRPVPTRLLGIPIRCDDLYVSVEDPTGLLAELQPIPNAERLEE
jgi:hypothetical protein